MDLTQFFLLNVGASSPTPPGGGGIAHPTLTIDDKFFRFNGELWTGIASSEFSLAKRFMEGEDIHPLVNKRLEIGFNEFRIWLLNESVVGKVYPGGIHPKQYKDFYDRLRRLAELLTSYGIIQEYTAFTSCVPMMTDRDEQVSHWESVQNTLFDLKSVKLELVNEYNWGNGENSPHAELYEMKPSDIISSSGSSTADAPPPEPVWDYVLYHSNGLDEWQRKVGHNCMEWANHHHKPGGSNENTRCPDDDSNALHFHDASAGAALLCAGATFHSQGGKYSQPFDAKEEECAQAWVKGARSVPLEFQVGQYIRRDDLLSKKDCPTCHGTGQFNGHTCDTCDGSGWVIDYGTPENPGVIRAFERRLPDGRGHVVLIHA